MDLNELEATIAAMLAERVRAEAIPAVMRRPVKALDGRSMLEAGAAGDLEAVAALVRVMFDLRRVQG